MTEARRKNHLKFHLEIRVDIPEFLLDTHGAMVERVRTFMQEPRNKAYTKPEEHALQSRDGLIDYFHNQFNKAMMSSEVNTFFFTPEVRRLHRKKSKVPTHVELLGDDVLHFGMSQKLFTSSRRTKTNTHSVIITDEYYTPIMIDALLCSESYVLPFLVAKAYRRAVYNTLVHYKMNNEGLVFMKTTLAQFTIDLIYSDFLMNRFHVNDFGAGFNYVDSVYGRHEYNYNNGLFTVRKSNIANSKRKTMKL